jgi:hypothetical protein
VTRSVFRFGAGFGPLSLNRTELEIKACAKGDASGLSVSAAILEGFNGFEDLLNGLVGISGVEQRRSNRRQRVG